uniref:Reverse transcriptase domain-containing protein n=1 Tax=Salarias fasciatus TaxID=181472 RepID=A0A672H0D0_SALFA
MGLVLHRGTRQGCPLSPLLFVLAIEPLAIAIRNNQSIHGIERYGKLSFYADSLLLSVSKAETTIPLILELLKQFGEISGYKLNLHKSELLSLNLPDSALQSIALPFKIARHSFIYLSVMVTRNFCDLFKNNLDKLQKMNLDKWNKIRLTLWGRVNVIKMVVSPQFNYPLMMLPVTVPPSIFNKYDALIKLAKLCLPRDKGGLALPDPSLNYISFEMTELAIHWTGQDNLDWVILEKSLSFPFIPLELLSQNPGKIPNPIMLHSKEVWMKIHKILT